MRAAVNHPPGRPAAMGCVAVPGCLMMLQLLPLPFFWLDVLPFRLLVVAVVVVAAAVLFTSCESPDNAAARKSTGSFFVARSCPSAEGPAVVGFSDVA